MPSAKPKPAAPRNRAAKKTPQPSSPDHRDLAAVAAFFAEHGYYHGRGVFDPATVNRLEADFDRIVAQITATGEDIDARRFWDHQTTRKLDGDRPSVVIHTHQVQKYSAAWSRLLLDDRLLDVASCLLGPDIILHHTKLFLKPAGHGGAFPPHQDHGYFPTLRGAMIAANVVLSRQDETNGCLRVWPGSHRHGPLPASKGDNEAFARRFPIAASNPIICEPGDLVIFHFCTVHASLANRGQRDRKHVLIQLHPGDDRQLDGVSHPDSNLVLRGWNPLMTRQRAGAS